MSHQFVYLSYTFSRGHTIITNTNTVQVIVKLIYYTLCFAKKVAASALGNRPQKAVRKQIKISHGEN